MRGGDLPFGCVYAVMGRLPRCGVLERLWFRCGEQVTLVTAIGSVFQSKHKEARLKLFIFEVHGSGKLLSAGFELLQTISYPPIKP
jgi:hypothetical protein